MFTESTANRGEQFIVLCVHPKQENPVSQLLKSKGGGNRDSSEFKAVFYVFVPLQ